MRTIEIDILRKQDTLLKHNPLRIFQNYSLISSPMTILWLFVHEAAMMTLFPFNSNPYLSCIDGIIDSPFCL